MNEPSRNTYLIAKWQKQILWLVVLSLVCLYVHFGMIFVGAYCVYAMYQLARALKSPVPILWAVLAFIPIISLLTLFFLNQRATVALREAGIRVGFMGVSEADMDMLAGSNATPPAAPSSVPPAPTTPPEAHA